MLLVYNHWDMFSLPSASYASNILIEINPQSLEATVHLWEDLVDDIQMVRRQYELLQVTVHRDLFHSLSLFVHLLQLQKFI